MRFSLAGDSRIDFVMCDVRLVPGLADSMARRSGYAGEKWANFVSFFESSSRWISLESKCVASWFGN